MNDRWIPLAYWASAVMDAVIAVAFLFFLAPVFTAAGVELPNHPGYLQFPALLLVVFAAMYARIAGDPRGRKDLMPYGMGLKISFVLVAFWHWTTGTLPWLWLPLAWIDLVFLIVFFIGWQAVRKPMPA